MKALLSGLILALIVQSAFAQKPPVKFGSVSMEELKMTAYSADSSAAAVVLADFGESSLRYDQEKGFVLHFDRIKRIKILKKEGLYRADMPIYLYEQGDNEEKISSVKAVTYNLENGKIVESKMKGESMLREQHNKNSKKVTIVWPNVKEGSVIEVSYHITSDFIANFQDWEFQEEIPAVLSEYRATIPEYFSYDKYMQGYIGLATAEEKVMPGSIMLTSKERVDQGNATRTEYSSEKIDFNETRYRWVAQNVPAFKEEPFLTTYKDYISKINFELSFTRFPHAPIKNYMGSWDEIGKRYAEGVEPEIKGNQFLKKVAEEVTTGLSTPEEKIAAIHNYVRSTFNWNHISNDYFSGALKKVFDEKKGSSAEINLVLASMLEKVDINVQPVLISTRDHGFVRKEIPMSTQFNYLICRATWNDKQVLLDATDKVIPTGVLPMRCLNGQGMVVSKEGVSWVSLAASAKSKITISADLALSADHKFIGKVTLDRTGYFAADERNKYLSTGEPDYIKSLLENKPWEITKSQFEGVHEISKAFRAVHEFTMDESVTVAGDMVYFNPLFLWRTEENPFKTEERMYPVDFGNMFDKTNIVKITIPENYSIEEMPTSKVAMLPENAGKFMFNAVKIGNVISITNTLQINRSLYTQAEYQNLREFYKLLVAKHSEQVVLKKIK
jgi:hypothetical protein